MALTITVETTEIVGRHREVRGLVTFDSSYPTNGEAVTPADFGLTQLTDLRLEAGPGGYVPVWNQSTTAAKLKVLMGDNNNASDGPLIEVANTTNLSAVVARYTATGY